MGRCITTTGTRNRKKSMTISDPGTARRRGAMLILGIVIAICLLFLVFTAKGQSPVSMKINAGIVTPKLQETKKFYQDVLGFGVVFENDFYVLMHTPDHQTELSFLLPDHPSQQAVFQPPFSGKGVYLTIEVPDVEAMYRKIKALSIPIVVELREEPWGDRHFAIQDPTGVSIDFVTYTAPKSD